MTSNDESWTIESELAARTEIWQVWPLLHNAATCRKEKTIKLCPGENAGDPRSNCGVRDFPDDSRLCWSHRIPSQVNFPKTHFCPTFSAPSLIISRWITPLTITPAVAMIGISLFDAASYYSQGNWGIAIL